MSAATGLPAQRRRRELILDEVAAERERQIVLHGDQSSLPLGLGQWETVRYLADAATDPTDAIHSPREFAEHLRDRVERAVSDHGLTFEAILTERYAEVVATEDPFTARAQLIQLAAVCLQIVEAMDWRSPRACPHGCGATRWTPPGQRSPTCAHPTCPGRP